MNWSPRRESSHSIPGTTPCGSSLVSSRTRKVTSRTRLMIASSGGEDRKVRHLQEALSRDSRLASGNDELARSRMLKSSAVFAGERDSTNIS